MPPLLSDPTTTMYVVFGTMVVVLGALAARRQKRSDIITFLIGAGLLLTLFLVDLAFESPREVVSRKLEEMAVASRARKYDDVFKHISESFQYKSLDKRSLRNRAAVAESHFPEGLTIWNVSRANHKAMVDGALEQEFDFQPVGHPQFRYQCVGVFKKDPDGEWRLTTFRLYPVVSGDGQGRQEVTPPGL